jgi:hypothetical protein
VRKVGVRLATDLEGQAGLAHPTGTGEGEQPNLLSQQEGANRGEVLLSIEETIGSAY